MKVWKQQKTLIITAHPSSHGLTHGIAHVLKEKREEEGGTVEILDLYKTDLKQPFLAFENVREIAPDPVRTAMQQKILWADELIFVHPIWWLSMPAIMKNFLDQNFSAHFAYNYTGGWRHGMLGGRTARVYVTCDARRWIYALMAFPFVSSWVLGTLIFCGIDVTGFSITRNLNFKSDIERTARLKELKKNSRKQNPIFSILNFLGRVIKL